MRSKLKQGQKGIGLIQSLKRGAGFLFALVVYLADMQTQGQGTLHITFDGPLQQQPGTVLGLQQYHESGLLFTPLGFSFGRAGGGIPQLPENGTAYLQAALSQSLTFSFTNGVVFDLSSVDLAEYSTVVPDAVTVRFLGYRFDGSIVTTDLTIDGTGPIADFQTFNFGPEWSGLSRVEIPTYGWSLDNLVVSIPELGTWALLLVGGALAGCRVWKRRAL